MTKTFSIKEGRRYPMGATVQKGGVNFSIYSRHAHRVELLLYEAHDSQEPFQVVELHPARNHTFFTWHVLVVGLPVGTHYTWRVDGPSDTVHTGSRYDSRWELVDPWARAVTSSRWDRWAHLGGEGGIHHSIRAVVVSDCDYDWEGDEVADLPTEQMVIYELHVGGFTRHASSGVTHPGTFLGLIDKIPYLQSLGITHVELMPVHAFDEQDVPPMTAAKGLRNFWGYSTHSFFSPHPNYCVAAEAGSHRCEFRDMVKALHRAGIGVILDVVYNHTAEGNSHGPHINFKGFGNETFYHLDVLDKQIYRDYTGCGNTVNANHPFVTQYILESLEYWVREMHVDGFRFDLASTLTRGEDGAPLANPPVLWAIELSDSLSASKIIAEAWDAAGLYQVGTFPGYRWSEWNGRYRDCLRRFVRGDGGLTGEMATRIAGSSDLYQSNMRLPINSINFVTCHDGFTLWDLVSYNQKHNLANGEGNRDGNNHNLSWNCGQEGASKNGMVLALRHRQVRNLMAIQLLSQGVPMLLAGDEMLRTQQGNNNTWCQDNALGWIDWTLAEKNADMVRFTREMIALRRRHPNLQRRLFFHGVPRAGSHWPDICWFGPDLDAPDWDNEEAGQLAFMLGDSVEGESLLFVMLNMSDQVVAFSLPRESGLRWLRAVDTSLAAPADICPRGKQPAHRKSSYPVGPRSVVVLESA